MKTEDIEFMKGRKADGMARGMSEQEAAVMAFDDLRVLLHTSGDHHLCDIEAKACRREDGSAGLSLRTVGGRPVEIDEGGSVQVSAGRSHFGPDRDERPARGLSTWPRTGAVAPGVGCLDPADAGLVQRECHGRLLLGWPGSFWGTIRRPDREGPVPRDRVQPPGPADLR